VPNPYPRPFVHGDFPAVAPAVLPALASVPRVHAPTNSGGTVQLPTRAWIRSLTLTGEGRRDSESFANFAGSGVPVVIAAPDATRHYTFVPGVDRIRIHGDVRHIGQVQKLRIELWSASAQNAGAVATLERRDGAAQNLLRRAEGIRFSELVYAGYAALMPDGVPNVVCAPYQLRAEVTCTTGTKTTAWTYFDVRVHSIDLEWGARAMIPAGDIGGGLRNPWRALTRRDEPALVDALQADDVEIPDHGDVDLPLRSTSAAYTHFDEWSKSRDFAFLRHKLRWGNGPRLPVVAKVFLRRRDGSRVHSGASSLALGPAEFLWDWRDRDAGERDIAEYAGARSVVKRYVKAALNYRPNAANEPPGCLNCHVHRGGKRGGRVRVLLETDGTGDFPFVARAAGTRTWSVISKAHSTGPHAGRTGVLFQPSRMALDSYRLQVFLATSTWRPTLDVAAGRSNRLVADHPGLPTRATAMLVVKRRIDARYVRKSAATTPMDLDAVEGIYKLGGLDVRWTQAFWNAVEFRNLMATALAPDNAGEVAGWAGGGLYDVPCVERRDRLNRRGLPLLRTMPRVTAAMALFDQWSGQPANSPVANEANFTVLGKDLIDRQIVGARVVALVNASGPSIWTAAGRLRRRWDAFVLANPTWTQHQAAHDFYYNGMSQAERNQIRPLILQDYATQELRDFDSLPAHAPKWLNENYPYNMSGLHRIAIEMCVRKMMADNFEGMTFFHYTHLIEPVDGNGGVMGRQCDLGGIAATEMSIDLGLNAGFLVWDHPDDGSRLALKKVVWEASGHGDSSHMRMKDGNLTAAHEFGHFLHLPHREGCGAEGHFPAAHYRGDQPDHRCLMDYDPDGTFLCGVCALRVRGWAWLHAGGMRGLGNTGGTAGTGPAPTATTLREALDAFQNVFVGSPLA
jgi:hypothetical protein